MQLPAIPKSFSGKTLLDEVAMAIMAAVSVFLVIYETREGISFHERELIRRVDFGISAIFLAELGYRFYLQDDKKRFAKRHWWQLLACIPVTAFSSQAMHAFPLLRMLRLVSLFRLIRVVMRTQELMLATERFVAQTNLLHLTLVEASISLAGALGFHYFEYGTNPNVNNFWDSYWWTWVTITTVGYGDIYPVTDGGRIVAILLMITGIGTLGTFIALVGKFFIKAQE